MKKIFIVFLLVSLLISGANAKEKGIDFSLVVSGGVSLGAYEAGYNWAIIKMLKDLKGRRTIGDVKLKSVSGASAGSINSLLSAMYWCQKSSVHLKNSVDDNLYYDTWVDLDIEDLIISGKDPNNKSSLFTQKPLEEKGESIIKHLNRAIYEKNCKVPLGISVTKVTPIVENISGLQVKNQHFSVPLTFKEHNGRGVVVNRTISDSKDFYISIPGIRSDKKRLIKLLLASAAFPGAFKHTRLEYEYKKERHSSYFMDGGLYDNIPVGLAMALDRNTSTLLFISPGNMRKEAPTKSVYVEHDVEPVGFLGSSLLPVFSSFDIMQSAKLYEAINQNFRDKRDKRLLISSRYQPITGMYLQHFAAFFDRNFRLYDYHVGVYDAVYNLSVFLKKDYPDEFASSSLASMMDNLMKSLEIDRNSTSYRAYEMLKNNELEGKIPETNDMFSAIFNAFNHVKPDDIRYDADEFEEFLSRLDITQLKFKDGSFLSYAKKNTKGWYKRPLGTMIERISVLENQRAEIDSDYKPIAMIASVSAWLGRSYFEEKNGFYYSWFAPDNNTFNSKVPYALWLLPNDIAVDLKNGGFSFGYSGVYYNENKEIFDGFELKGSYVFESHAVDFVRFDTDAFKEFDDTYKIGIGPSFFGNTEGGSFYDKDRAFGYNAYIDFIDIFRLTYAHRYNSDKVDEDYVYFGVQSIPSLINWMKK